MNIYQLADALEKIETYNQVMHRSFNDKTKLMASADMLRKQANRIVELEKAKTLTDEEILSEWNLTSYDPKTYIWSDDVDEGLIIQFARSILEKANENG